MIINLKKVEEKLGTEIRRISMVWLSTAALLYNTDLEMSDLGNDLCI